MSNDGDLVSLETFERILQGCHAVDEQPNAFCRYLLETCSQFNAGEALIDFRLFFNSVFQALKRRRVDDPHVNFVNAELFVVDHFWSCMFGKECHGMKEGYADFKDFQTKMFCFFNQPVDPLLHIHEIEQVIQECFNYLVDRKKRRDIISKKTVRKVVYKGLCQKVFIQALLRGSRGGDQTDTLEGARSDHSKHSFTRELSHSESRVEARQHSA